MVIICLLSQQTKNTKKAVLALFLAYVRQRDGNIGHILLIQGPIWEILATIAHLLGVVENLSFFESAILNLFFQKKLFFCFTPMKISRKLCVKMDGTQFSIL